MIQALEMAVFAALNAAPNLTALVEDRIYARQTPPNTQRPYVIFAYEEGGYQTSSPREALDMTYRVTCVADSRQEAMDGAEQIHNALHNQPLNISGWSHYDTSGQDWHVEVVNLGGQQFYRAGALYRIRADQDD